MFVFWGYRDGGVAQVKFDSFMMIINTKAILSLVLSKYRTLIQCKKMTGPVDSGTHAGDVNTTTKVEILPPKFYTTKLITRYLHMGDSQIIHEYNRILYVILIPNTDKRNKINENKIQQKNTY